MTKKEYSDALKSPKWITKRSLIRKRDGNKCVKCFCKTLLHVHHKYYIEGKIQLPKNLTNLYKFILWHGF